MTALDPEKALEGLLQPVSLSELEVRTRIILYGPKGTGKTTTIMKVLEKTQQKALAITADSAGLSIMKDSRWAHLIDRMPWAGGFSQINMSLDKIDSGEWDHKWLILDPISSMVAQWIAADVVTHKYPQEYYDPDVPSRTHYGRVLYQMRNTVSRLNKSDVNVAFITHMKDYEKEPALRPNLPSETYQTIADEVNLIGYCTSDRKIFKVQVQPSPRITAVSQLPGVPSEIYVQDEFAKLLAEWILNQGKRN